MSVLDHLPLVRLLAHTFDFAPTRPSEHPLLSPDRFPLAAQLRDIVASDGTLIATAVDSVMAQEIATRLNAYDWQRQEDQWAL